MRMLEEYGAKIGMPVDAQYFDITAVARWFQCDKERLEFNAHNLPPIVPPFSSLWMEFQEPKEAMDRTGIIGPNPWAECATGAWLVTRELDYDYRDQLEDFTLADALGNALEAWMRIEWKLPAEDTSLHDDIFDALQDDIVTDFTGVRPLPRWIVMGLLYMYHPRRDGGEICRCVLGLDDDGKYMGGFYLPHVEPIWFTRLPPPYMQRDYAAYMAHPHTSQRERRKMTHETAAFLLSPFLFSLALLHCRNVEYVDVAPIPDKIRRQRARRGIPEIKYKVLDVRPLRTVRQGGSRPEGDAVPVAMHFVRGHFKTFNARGLFGKYKGTFWWGDQVRGDHEVGIVDKDYRVKR